MTGTTLQAVVVGAGPGLGRSLALMLARNGLDVGLVSRDASHLSDLVSEIEATGRVARIAEADAADTTTLVAAIQQLSSEAPIQVIAYNAFTIGGRLIDTDVEGLRQASDINLHSPVAAARTARADLAATGGAVLITGGGVALHPAPQAGVLSVGKASLRMAASMLADDLAADGITVRTVTITGAITPGTAFDPDTIADTFWRIRKDPNAAVEFVFDGIQTA